MKSQGSRISSGQPLRGLGREHHLLVWVTHPHFTKMPSLPSGSQLKACFFFFQCRELSVDDREPTSHKEMERKGLHEIKISALPCSLQHYSQ